MDLNLDECYFSFSTKPGAMSEEEREAFTTCLQTNEIVFEYLLPSRDCRSLARVAYYLLDQGLRAKVAKEHFASAAEKNDDKSETQAAIDISFKEA